MTCVVANAQAPRRGSCRKSSKISHRARQELRTSAYFSRPAAGRDTPPLPCRVARQLQGQGKTNYWDRSLMKALPFFAVALCLAGLVGARSAHARPVIIEELATIPNPDPSLSSFGTMLGIDGDDAIILGHASLPPSDEFDNPDTLTRALRFRTVGDAWPFVGLLPESIQFNEADAPNQYAIEMRNGIAAVAMIGLRVFERVGDNYLQSPVAHIFNAPTQYVDIDGG